MAFKRIIHPLQNFKELLTPTFTPKQKSVATSHLTIPFFISPNNWIKSKIGESTNSTQLGFSNFSRLLQLRWRKTESENPTDLCCDNEFNSSPNGRSWTFPKVSLNFSSRTRRYSRNKTSSQWWGGGKEEFLGTLEVFFFFFFRGKVGWTQEREHLKC